MKLLIWIILVGSCTYDRADWDSGAQAQRQYQEEARQDQVERTRNELKGRGPSILEQPF